MSYAPVETAETPTAVDHNQSPPSSSSSVDLSGRIGSDLNHSTRPHQTDGDNFEGKQASADKSNSATSFFSSFLSSNMNNSDSSGAGGGAAGSSSLLSHFDSNPEFQSFLSSLRARKWAQTLRPIPVFLGVEGFSKPRTTQEAMARLEANAGFFLSNYMLICSIVCVITILSRPWLIVIGALLAAMWLYASRMEELRLPQTNVVLQGRQKQVALVSTTAIVLFICAGTTLFFLVGICATLVVGHAILHVMPPLDDGEGEQSAEMNEFGSPGEQMA